LLKIADGDGRALLNLIENIISWKISNPLTVKDLSVRLSKRLKKYDKKGEEHYNLISALHKSIRGSDPDAALYWLARILDGGEDPRFIARRLLRMALEDVGLADPQAQTICLHAWQSFERLGSPEGELALAQAALYLALAPKSNASYKGFNLSLDLVKQTSSEPPPKHILNAPTDLMREQGYGVGYEYDHDNADGFSGQNYFPEKIERSSAYQPVERGFERELKKRISYFKSLREKRKSI
jgi:putative ATPase